MSMSGHKSRLATVTRELSTRWDETREHWRDAKSEEFHKKYLDDLFANVDNAIGVIDQLDQLLAKIRSDCE